jgi:hypothetical protein
MHIEDYEHGRGSPEFVPHLATDTDPHDLSSTTEQGEIWVAFDHG